MAQHLHEQQTMATDTTNPTRPPPPSSSPSSPPSHYDVLQISSSATTSSSGTTAKPPTLSEITQAYHRAARRCHPDRRRRSLSHDDADDSAADEEFRRIQQAWECLRDAERRKAYDAARQWRHIRQRQRQNSAIRIEPTDCYEGECECEQCDDEYDVEEEEHVVTMELFYDCRCGHAVAMAEADPDDNNLVECQGCSLLYDTTPVWQQQQQQQEQQQGEEAEQDKNQAS